MQTNIKRLGEFVRAKRREQKLSQVELALLAGVGRRFISELESGEKGSLRIDKVDAVLEVLGKRLGIVDHEHEV